MSRINPEFKNELNEQINQYLNNRSLSPDSDFHITRSVAYNPAAQWLIKNLISNNIPYKVKNVGAGVKMITTDTDTCPFCRKKL